MKVIFRFIAIIAVGLGIFFTQNGLPKNLPFSGQQSQVINTAQKAPSDSSAPAKKEISIPAPLKVQSKWLADQPGSSKLTADGVVEFTNNERAKAGLPALAVNAKLNTSAKIKVEDMFKGQYFEHTSPSGVAISDLGQEVGYDYILIGENLAMGDFKDDQSLVSAWMESPKHRANILNSHYTDIGVAVGQGTFNGQEVWLAVQHFGRPLDLCPEIDASLKQTIDSNKATIDELSQELKLDTGGAAAAIAYITDFNKVREYNSLVEQTSKDITTYNAEVADFNNCIQK